MRTLLALSVMIALSGTAGAEMNTTVPDECVALAMRNGIEAVIHGRRDLAIAVAKLARAKASEPGVLECRAAVKRIRLAK
jgi:hypothetical protein